MGTNSTMQSQCKFCMEFAACKSKTSIDEVASGSAELPAYERTTEGEEKEKPRNKS